MNTYAHYLDQPQTHKHVNRTAAAIYLGYVVYSAVLAAFWPGPVVMGLPIPSENNRQLPYVCNGVSSFYTTLLTAFALHYTGIFKMQSIVDNFGGIMTVAILTGMSREPLE